MLKIIYLQQIETPRQNTAKSPKFKPHKYKLIFTIDLFQTKKSQLFCVSHKKLKKKLQTNCLTQKYCNFPYNMWEEEKTHKIINPNKTGLSVFVFSISLSSLKEEMNKINAFVFAAVLLAICLVISNIYWVYFIFSPFCYIIL